MIVTIGGDDGDEMYGRILGVLLLAMDGSIEQWNTIASQYYEATNGDEGASKAKVYRLIGVLHC